MNFECRFSDACRSHRWKGFHKPLAESKLAPRLLRKLTKKDFRFVAPTVYLAGAHGEANRKYRFPAGFVIVMLFVPPAEMME